MINLKIINAGQFLYKKDETGITKAVVIDSDSDAALLFLISYIDEVGDVHQFKTPQRHLLIASEASLWFTSLDKAGSNTSDDTKIEEWLLGIGGSDIDDVLIVRFKATEKSAIKKLMKKIRNDQKCDTFDTGTTSAKNLKHDERGYYGYNSFCDYHVDYRLTKLNNIDQI